MEDTSKQQDTPGAPEATGENHESPQQGDDNVSLPAENSESTHNHEPEHDLTEVKLDAAPSQEQEQERDSNQDEEHGIQSKDIVKLRNPISQWPTAPTSGSTTQLSLELTPRPQSYVVQGSATLPIRGPLRPLSTAIRSDAPSEQFDTLYDTLPFELRNKKQKTKTVSIELLPAVPVKSIDEEQVESPTENIALTIDKDNNQEAPVYKGLGVDPLSSEYPNNHRILTIVSMVLCGVILNVFAFSCLIPAFIFSIKSKALGLDGEWNEALKFAKRTLILNLVAIIGSVIGLFVVFIIVQIILGAAVYT